MPAERELSPKCKDWADWSAAHLPQSPPFVNAVGELRRQAAGRHERTTGPLAAYTFGALAELRPATDRAGRPARAWREPPCSGGYTYEHVVAYKARLRAVAARYIGHPDRAAELHEHVRGGELSLPPAGHPARWDGPVASRLAAHVTGASYALGGATAMRQSWRSQRPRVWAVIDQTGFAFHAVLP